MSNSGQFDGDATVGRSTWVRADATTPDEQVTLTVEFYGEVAQRIMDAAEQAEESAWAWLVSVVDYYLSGT